MGNCVKRAIGLPQVHHSDYCLPMFSCGQLKKLLSVKVKWLHSTRDMSVIQHQRLLFFRFLTTATRQQNLPWKQRAVVCIRFLVCSYWTEPLKMRPKVYVKATNTDLLLHYQSHVDSRLNEGCWKPCLIVRTAYRYVGHIFLKNATAWKHSSIGWNIRKNLSVLPSEILLLQRLQNPTARIVLCRIQQI